MIHPETTMVTNNNPSRGRMSPRCSISCVMVMWGHEIYYGINHGQNLKWGKEALQFWGNDSHELDVGPYCKSGIYVLDNEAGIGENWMLLMGGVVGVGENMLLLRAVS
ncbi:hypothetical protein Tco_1094519 [Tanacetum coccineum]|uniref:Uncharacterized protein n=1 Tax=Tanacetum coccineum TaxID=301880 RepID=A0ABQ5IFR2_9ASTR